MSKKFLSGINVTGTATLNTVANAGLDTDKFLVLDSAGNIDYRTGEELKEDIGANVVSRIEHEVKLGETMSIGTPVYVGVDLNAGTNMTVYKASNATEAKSSKTMGLVASSGITNDLVEVITEGLLAGLNTSTATKGDPVWLGVDGALIFGLANKPVAPAHLVSLGVVTRVQSNNGEIFVKVQNGFEMNEIHNYLEGSVQNNEVIVYESATSLYKPKTIPTILGYTPVTNARTLTINGTSYDLSADRSWTITTDASARSILRYVATAGQTTFTISGGYTPGLVDVYQNGAKLDNETDFDATNGTTIVLTNAAAVNDVIEVYRYQTAFLANNALRQIYEFVATAGQTTFLANYNTGMVDVFYNGSKLVSTEYTAGNGTSIILGFACNLNDTIEIHAYSYQVGAFTGQAQLNGTGFVKANGTTITYDNSTYLPLSGGTLTGALNGTSATFSGSVGVTGNLTIGNPSSALAQFHIYNASAAASMLVQTNSASNYSEIAARNYNQTSTSYYRQYSSSASGTDFGASRANLAALFSNYASNFAIGTMNGGDLIFGTANTERLRIVASNGAATFSSSVTSSGLYTTSVLRLYNGSSFATISFDGSQVLGNYNLNWNGSGVFSSTITANGNITISSSTPALILNDISGAAAGSILFQNNGTQKYNLTTLASSNDFALYNNGGTNSYNIVVKYSSGNVGFGTTSPYANLDLGASGANNIILRNTSNAYNLGYIGNSGGRMDIGFSDSNGSLSPLPYLSVTSGGITQVSNLRTNTLYSEYTKNLSGAYSSGTYYEIANSSQLTSGIYIIKAYVDTYAIGGGTYFCTYVSVPFFFYTQGTNNGGTVTLPAMIGSGHANMNPPTIRVRLSSGSLGGLTYIEFDPNANWSNVQGVGGATVTFYVKRIGD